MFPSRTTSTCGKSSLPWSKSQSFSQNEGQKKKASLVCVQFGPIRKKNKQKTVILTRVAKGFKIPGKIWTISGKILWEF